MKDAAASPIVRKAQRKSEGGRGWINFSLHPSLPLIFTTLAIYAYIALGRLKLGQNGEKVWEGARYVCFLIVYLFLCGSFLQPSTVFQFSRRATHSRSATVSPSLPRPHHHPQPRDAKMCRPCRPVGANFSWPVLIFG